MEPMTLGSPSNSGPSSPTTTPSGSPYLPSFLLGEPASPLPGSTSPKVKRGNITDSQLSATPRYVHSQSAQQNFSPGDRMLHSNDRTPWPPIRGLFDTITSPTHSEDSKKTSADVNNYKSVISRQFSEVRTPTIVPEAADSTWVTVFGFPPAATSFILAQMQFCGRMASKRVPASGNWMHIQFSSKLEAKRALAYNGKVFARSIMIGVVPCRDESILQESRIEQPPNELLSPIPTSPRHSGFYPDVPRTPDTSLYDSSYGSPRISQVRTLGSRQEAEIYGSGNAPQKSSGIVSKAMEYFLSW